MKTTLTIRIMLVLLGLTTGLKAQIVNVGTAYLSDSTTMSAVSAFKNKANASFYNDGRTYFYNDFRNDGSFDFYAQSAYSTFVGQQPQQISGLETSYFYTLDFNNALQPDAFRLKGTIFVEGRVYFQHGIVNTRDDQGRFVFGPTAIHQFTSDQSHVNGPVEKIGEQAFAYPVGQDGVYRPAGTDPMQNEALYTVTYFHEDPTALFDYTVVEHGITAIDKQEYWNIEADSDLPKQLITLSWDAQTTPQEYIQAAQDDKLVIVVWNPQEQRWENKGGTIDPSNNTITGVVEQTGVFTLGIEKPEVPDCQIEVFNLVDVSGKTDNKYLRIEDDGSCSKITKVSVFNRWGIKVFETAHYGPEHDVFNGYSSGRMSIDRSQPLPAGTYFYIINYQNKDSANPASRQKVGYLYILSK